MSAVEAACVQEATAGVHATAAERELHFELLTEGSGCDVAVHGQRPKDILPLIMMSPDQAENLQ